MRPVAVMPHNPLVEPQRPGWCVMREFPADDQRDARRLWLIGVNTWSASHERAMVFGSYRSAKEKAENGAVVTTVVRFNGHVVEWQVVSG
jgi:hypothetical protein